MKSFKDIIEATKSNKKQTEIIDKMNNYLTSNEFGKRDGIYIVDNNDSTVQILKKIILNKKDITLIGNEFGKSKKIKDKIEFNQIMKIYKYALKNDDEFKNYL